MAPSWSIPDALRADLALARPALRDPGFAEPFTHGLTSGTTRHEPPGLRLLVGRQLDRAELQVDVPPVESAYLLLARHAGIAPIGYANKPGKHERLTKRGAHIVIDGQETLTAALRRAG